MVQVHVYVFRASWQSLSLDRSFTCCGTLGKCEKRSALVKVNEFVALLLLQLQRHVEWILSAFLIFLYQLILFDLHGILCVLSEFFGDNLVEEAVKFSETVPPFIFESLVHFRLHSLEEFKFDL